MQYDVIRNFQKERLFWGRKYLRMEDQKPGLVRKQDFAKRGETEAKVIFSKHFLTYGGAVKKLM